MVDGYREMTNCSSHRRGSALIFVLIVVSSMTILALSLARRCRVESKLAHLSAYKTKTYIDKSVSIKYFIGKRSCYRDSPTKDI